MKPPKNRALVFALDEDTMWEDLEDAMSGSVEYQNTKLGKIGPLMFFAPMMEPENLDAWEPIKVVPHNLLVVSIERKVDNVILKAIRLAKAILGEVMHEGSSPLVHIKLQKPLADVYEQMSEAQILAYAFTHFGKDDASFFFIRTLNGVKAFSDGLQIATR